MSMRKWNPVHVNAISLSWVWTLHLRRDLLSRINNISASFCRSGTHHQVTDKSDTSFYKLHACMSANASFLLPCFFVILCVFIPYLSHENFREKCVNFINAFIMLFRLIIHWTFYNGSECSVWLCKRLFQINGFFLNTTHNYSKQTFVPVIYLIALIMLYLNYSITTVIMLHIVFSQCFKVLCKNLCEIRCVTMFHAIALQKQCIRLVDESGRMPGRQPEHKILIQKGIAYCAVHTVRLNI